MTDKVNPIVTTLHGDEGEDAAAMAKAIFDYRGRTRQDPTTLVIGVDLYEHLVVNRSNVSYWANRAFGYSSGAVVAYPDTFMGIPLALVPDKGMVRAIGSPFDMLMMHGGKRTEENSRPGVATTLPPLDRGVLAELSIVLGLPFSGAQREMLNAQCSALGLAPGRAEIECQIHGTTLEVLIHALARGWTPESELSPTAYEPVYLSNTQLAAMVDQLSMLDPDTQWMRAVSELTKKYVPLLAAAKTDEERDAISKQWTAERRALPKDKS